MKIVYADSHRQHAPAHELTRRGPIPYPESPARAEAVLQALQDVGFADVIPPREYPLDALLAVHDPDYLHYLEHAYPAWVAAGQPEEGVVSVTFALRRQARKPGSLVDQAGYYCYDTTPLVKNTCAAAVAAARCALTGADLLLTGDKAAYSLCRPPGHHAGRDLYGGYCYLNNAAVAAAHLSGRGPVAVLDIDYHHGNGTQDIFYTSDQVLFVSLHADPDRQYPFFWGRADEQGAGAGMGFNHNFPLPAGMDDDQYLQALDQALEIVAEFTPEYLVISAGVDTCKGDFWGDFALSPEGFGRIGERIAGLGLPALLVQEGGYDIERIGTAVANLLQGSAR